MFSRRPHLGYTAAVIAAMAALGGANRTFSPIDTWRGVSRKNSFRVKLQNHPNYAPKHGGEREKARRRQQMAYDSGSRSVTRRALPANWREPHRILPP